MKKNIWSIYLIIYSTFATTVCQQLMTPLLNVVYYFGKPNQWWQIDPIGNDQTQLMILPAFITVQAHEPNL